MWSHPQGLRSSRGFSLIEVIAAMAILSVAIVALIELYTASLRTTGKSYMNTLGMVYARSMMEEALTFSDMEAIMETNIDLGDGFTGSRSAVEAPAPEYAAPPADQPEEGAEAETLVMDSGTTYLITVEVRWPPSGGITLTAHKTMPDKEDLSE